MMFAAELTGAYSRVYASLTLRRSIIYFKRLKTPGLAHNSYLMGCGEGLAVVIDPRRDVEEYLCLARDKRHNDLSIKYVLETHRQEDFEFGARTLAEMTGAQIVSGSHELFGQTDLKLKDKGELQVGTTRIVLLETPGHTPESVTYAVYAKDSGEKCWGVFPGDALFVGDTGHTDLTDPAKTGENAGILYDSIHRKIAPLGGQTLLYPAHGAGSACGGNISERHDSTLGIDMGTNPVFKKSRREFVEHKLSEKMARPPYFRHMERAFPSPGGISPVAAGPSDQRADHRPPARRSIASGKPVLDHREREIASGISGYGPSGILHATGVDYHFTVTITCSICYAYSHALQHVEDFRHRVRASLTRATGDSASATYRLGNDHWVCRRDGPDRRRTGWIRGEDAPEDL